MKISIIGTGHVGSTLAYTVLIKGLASELVLINRTYEKAHGDALDLIHAQSFTDNNIPIKAGRIEDAAESDLIVLTASVPSQKGMTNRRDLLPGNVEIYKNIVPKLAKDSPDAVFLVVTNPVDIMTYVTQQLALRDSHKVLGVGTLIDSARFRSELSQVLGIAPDDIRAYVFGEHGPTQFPAVSIASAGGEKITDEELCEDLLANSVSLGHKIMQAKGYTNYAIAMATSLVIESIARNSHRTMPICTLVEDYLGVKDVCLSVPAVMGRQGIIRIQKPSLNEKEEKAFQKSAEVIKEGIELIKGML